MKYEITLSHPETDELFYTYLEIPNGTSRPAGKHGYWNALGNFLGSNETQQEELNHIRYLAQEYGCKVQQIRTIKQVEYCGVEAMKALFSNRIGAKRFIEYKEGDTLKCANVYFLGTRALYTPQAAYYFSDGNNKLYTITRLNEPNLHLEHYTVGSFLCRPIKDYAGKGTIINNAGLKWLRGQVEGRCIENAYPPLALEMLQKATGLPFELMNRLDANGNLSDSKERMLFYCRHRADAIPTAINLLWMGKQGWGIDFAPLR